MPPPKFDRGLAWRAFREGHPLLAEQLAPFQGRAARRGNQGEHWWELAALPATLALYGRPKIIFPDIARESRFTLDTKGYCLVNTAYSIACDDLYLLGVLNSRPVFRWFDTPVPALGGAGGNEAGWLRWIRQYVARIPVVPAAPQDPRRRKIEDAVRAALTLAPRHAAAMSGSHEQEKLGRRLVALDAEIDAAVCALYGLGDAQRARMLAPAGS